ncbi:MAG TPA: MBL fold metallo-hydrolase [Cytophagaceae bacterium]|jgi:glyoxylase-like metal-dependent hydrolase (beta-lactamase superfamily II)|nr:MBL fold metallo-hydrolase [Cytophagaceae bacterium]
MICHPIDTGYFKLDGGAMFGVVPQSIWKKSNPLDENNLCQWAMRCLLVEEGNKLILIDTGIGNKQDAAFFKFYCLHGDATLIDSIRKAGFHESEITDVILTHLHLDHVGGAVSRDGELFTPTFANATYWVHQGQWDWATIHPNPREKASFLKENIQPLLLSGQLHFIKGEESPFSFIKFFVADGHTEKQLVPLINNSGQTLAYAADLIPSVTHLPLPYVASYDVRPLIAMTEKERFLQQALENKWTLFFEHDPVNECCTLAMTEKGIRADYKGKLFL